MLNQKNLKFIALGSAVFNFVILLLCNFVSVKVSMFGFSEKISWKLSDIADQYFIVYILLLIPILFVAIPFLKQYIGKWQKTLELGVPIVGFLLTIIVLFYTKSKMNQFLDIYSSAVKISGGLGYYLSLLSYITMFLASLMNAKDADLGNEQLNSLVKNASFATSKFTENAVNLAGEKIKEIKENN